MGLFRILSNEEIEEFAALLKELENIKEKIKRFKEKYKIG